MRTVSFDILRHRPLAWENRLLIVSTECPASLRASSELAGHSPIPSADIPSNDQQSVLQANGDVVKISKGKQFASDFVEKIDK